MRRLSQFRDSYVDLAIVLLNCCLAVVAVNCLLYAVYAWRDRTQARDRPAEPAVLATVYPAWTADEIAALFKEQDDLYDRYEPFTEFRPSPVRGKYLNVSSEGYRVTRDQGPWPPDPANFNVFVFGGSTTFGFGLPDHQTIPSYLQESLRREFCENSPRVYNFGRPYYFSSQERVLFEQLIVAGHTPDYAVFIDGVNDFYHWRGAPNWSDALTVMMERRNRRPALYEWAAEGLQHIPMGKAARSVRARLLRIHEPEEGLGRPPFDDPYVIQEVISRWRRNREMIRCIAREHRVQVAFVWQPTPTYRYDLAHHVLYKGDFAYFGEHRRSRYGYEAMDLAHRQSPVGDDFLWLADIQEGRSESLYVDGMHYTAAFSHEISKRIADHLQDEVCGRRPPQLSTPRPRRLSAAPRK